MESTLSPTLSAWIIFCFSGFLSHLRASGGLLNHRPGPRSGQGCQPGELAIAPVQIGDTLDDEYPSHPPRYAFTRPLRVGTLYSLSPAASPVLKPRVCFRHSCWLHYPTSQFETPFRRQDHPSHKPTNLTRITQDNQRYQTHAGHHSYI